jgi:class 3 adenylate cyclase
MGGPFGSGRHHEHSGFIQAVLRIGSDPNDDEDLRLRKSLLLWAVVLLLPPAVLWGAMYWFLGEALAATVPWTYAVITTISIGVFALNRRYAWFAALQFSLFLLLPFALMWALGGFVAGSAVAVWGWVSPLGARIIGHRRASFLLLAAFAALLVLSAILQPLTDASNQLPDAAIVGLFVLNIVAAAGITFSLVGASAGGREGALDSMRRIVRRYFSPDIANAILTDPARQELGGEVAEVTILFADLGGFTSYAGVRSPAGVVEMLNAYFAIALPAILTQGGTPVSLPGDALMAVFGAPRVQPDHASSAARAALAIRDGSSVLAEDHPGWPRFRIGLNTGETLVGNIGSDEFRNFTAIGDTANMAQRFQTLAEPGQIAIGPATAALLGGSAELAPLGPVVVKGKTDAVELSALVSMTDDH